MQQNEKIIKIIETFLNDLNSYTRDKLYQTTSNIESIINRFYSKGSSFQDDIKYVRGQLGILISNDSDEDAFGNNLKSVKEFYKGILESLLLEAKEIGLPSKSDIKMGKSINVNVNQSQNQKQNQKSEISIFIESIKDELKGKEFKELIEIAKNEQDPEKAKPKIIVKLKSFGESVITNILTNIITNPSVWTGLIG